MMRALIPLSLVALTLAATPARAEAMDPPPPEPPAWTLQVDPLTVLLGLSHIQVERRLAPHFSIYVGPNLHLFDNPLDDKPEDYLGLGLEVGLRYFFSPTAPEGWWVQVRGVGAFLQTSDGEKTAPGGYISALGGYTAIFDGWFVLAGGLGVQYLHYTIAGQGPEGILPAAHTTLGVAF